MKSSIITLMAIQIIGLSIRCYGQNEENIWVFGRRAGLNFNSPTPQPILSSITGYQGRIEGCASVCDENGELLFYTNGSFVWDRDHQIMCNGESLTGYYASEPQFDSFTSSTSQGALIVPFPHQSEKYFIFSLTCREMGDNMGKLFYSVIDMSLNNGLGCVTGEKGILVDSLLTEHLTAVSGDQCNVWVMVGSRSETKFKAYEINEYGLNPNPVTSSYWNNNANLLLWELGNFCFSPNRRKLAVSRHLNGTYGSLELYDFNPATGHLTNPMNISFLSPYHGVCFSPDNSKLYANNILEIHQFDLSSGNPTGIAASKVILGDAFFTNLKLAKNGKIYFRSYGDNLGVINSPNMLGANCGFNQVEIELLPGSGMNTGSSGLPNGIPIVNRDSTYSNRSISGTCFSNKLLIEAANSAGWDYLWNDGNLGPQRSIYSSGTYWVSYHTSPCVFHTDTFHVVVPSGPVPEINTQVSCRAGSNGFAWISPQPGDSTVYRYIWRSDNDTTILSATDSLVDVPSGHYNVRITTLSGCDTILHFYLPEEDYRVSFTASDTLVCVGDTVQFNNTSHEHYDYFSFFWDFGDSTYADYSNPEHSWAASGVYRVILTGQGEICSDTSYQTIIVDEPVTDLLFTADREDVCAGKPMYFYPYSDSTTTRFGWDFGEGFRWEARINRQYQHAFDKAGTWPVTLTALFRSCPEVSYTDSIIVHPLPEVDLGSDRELCLQSAPFYLKNLREAPLIPYRQVWSTGDTTEMLQVVHPGIYTLSVTTEPIGCTTTESIAIKKDCYIDIPNVFTPNGDGHNDYFFPRQLLSESVTAFRMQVFNRWGQVIFETSNIDGRGWDGRFNNKAQPMGVYVYQIDVEFVNERKESFSGNVTLLR